MELDKTVESAGAAAGREFLNYRAKDLLTVLNSYRLSDGTAADTPSLA